MAKFQVYDNVCVTNIFSKNFGKTGIVMKIMINPWGPDTYEVSFSLHASPITFAEDEIELDQASVPPVISGTAIGNGIVRIPAGCSIQYIGVGGGRSSGTILFSEGDEVVVIDFGDMYCGQRARIKTVDYTDGSYLLEFDNYTYNGIKETRWYYNDRAFEAVKKSTTKAATCWSPQYIDDKWFTGKVFRYCKKCGKTPDEH